MATEIMNPIQWTVDNWKDYLIPFYNAYLSQYSDSAPISEIPVTIDYNDNTTEGDNFVTTFCYVNNWRHNYLQANRLTPAFMKWSVNLTKTGGNHCLIRVPIIKEGMTTPIVYSYFLAGSTNGITCDYHGKTSIIANTQQIEYVVGTGAVKNINNPSTTSANIDTRDNLYSVVSNATHINTLVNRINTTTDIKDYIREIFIYGVSNTPYHVLHIGTDNIYLYGTVNSLPQGYSAPIMGLDSVPNWLPLYYLDDASDVSKIINYLETGDDSERDDPFVPEYPEKYEIEDYETNFRVFVSPYEGDKTKTKFSVIAYNNELINHYENIEDYYGITVTETRSPMGQSSVIQTTPRLSMYPTVGFYTKVTEYWQLGMWFHNEGDTEHSLPFHCLFELSESSKTGCYVKGASLNGVGCTRTAIEDGHRFTGSNGHWVEVLYRTPTIEDLDSKYSDEGDEDDNHTGTDSDYSGAGGLRTFSIDASGFDAINKKLWSTDWTTVFKSTTIDPVRCVITCKSIPFTATNVANASVVIANLDTGVQRNYVKTVKTFDCGGVVIGYKRGDFTDFTHTHVRCYLPYIGWVELPAEEVISRKAYPEVGLSAHTKHLYFKYIVDFVDGSCRCIVSVGGTGEGRTDRWYFDGNCGVDMPVTSDNHTQAVSNALRSGVSTGLGVVSAIAGAVAGNAGAVGGGVMTALQNAPNMFPTYSFTATSNGSGYINSSMNQHIMLVVERVNVQEPSGYTSRLGKPCNMVLPLGSLRGFTKCNNVDVSGINATPDELAMIKGLLENGVYL